MEEEQLTEVDPEVEATKRDPIVEAMAILEADKRRRAQEFLAYVQQGERKFRCKLTAGLSQTADGAYRAEPRIVAGD